MFGVILGLSAALVLAVSAVGLVFVLGMRAKSPIVQGAIIWLGKHAFNKVQLRTAGTPGAYAAIIRHRGRVSGTAYETPVGVTATRRTVSSSRSRMAARTGRATSSRPARRPSSSRAERTRWTRPP